MTKKITIADLSDEIKKEIVSDFLSEADIYSGLAAGSCDESYQDANRIFSELEDFNEKGTWLTSK